MHTVSIEIDPSDYIDSNSVTKSVMSDALDMLALGRSDTAASILSNALGIECSRAKTDPEEDRKNKMLSIFMEWQAIDVDLRGSFWGWSHGKRKCS